MTPARILLQADRDGGGPTCTTPASPRLSTAGNAPSSACGSASWNAAGKPQDRPSRLRKFDGGGFNLVCREITSRYERARKGQSFTIPAALEPASEPAASGYGAHQA
jgi:hypothetical protein